MLRRLIGSTLVATIALTLVVAGPVQAERRVRMDDSSFIPVVKEIRKGKVVLWKNTSGRTHDVTSTSDNWSKAVDIAIGETTSHTFKKRGTYRYTCIRHSGMDGRIVVR